MSEIDLAIRRYGTTGPDVVVLHGGPGAPGCAGPLAAGLAGSFRVLEPWQRGSGDTPLTVARHVADLHRLIETTYPDTAPAMVGESWGAMLALAYAAHHPERIRGLVLVGCGTFDQASRTQLQRTREERIAAYLRDHPDTISDDDAHADDPLAQAIKWHHITDNVDIEQAPDIAFDQQACTETLQDLHLCQERGLYPQGFSAIASPAVMIHGDYDPHPGPMIHATLQTYLPQLTYHELAACGHSPWLERGIREAFFGVVSDWLAAR